MTDKERILAEINTLKCGTMDENKHFYSQEARGEYNALTILEAFINSMQEELVSDNLDEAIGESFTYLGNYDDDSRSDKLIETAYRCGFEAGVKWKELQITIKAV